MAYRKDHAQVENAIFPSSFSFTDLIFFLLFLQVGVYQIQMQVLSNAVNYAEGMRVGLACCSLLGFEGITLP